MGLRFPSIITESAANLLQKVMQGMSATYIAVLEDLYYLPLSFTTNKDSLRLL